ncbi:EF-hand domain-containing protein [Pseudobdellovibrio exovorus]|uniref:EF-hand domain-containing protein n=1 Tax=Pseudobdellovibrio exovorus JSS TaxID=1184267 RepID=M4V5I7_9BACT|nr:EF-hand domain-containing protein [Pseudobdellovibrio exovorus]AGH94448.1 hypothetical protein A11Q_228 [Pseudobdellovibrio exovorus JSS]
MKHTLLFSLLAAAFLNLSSCESITETHTKGSTHYSANELTAPRGYDPNGDGHVTFQEYMVEVGNIYGSMLKPNATDLAVQDCYQKHICQGLDANNDGRVSASEFFEGKYKIFKKFDRDNDNVLSADEFKEAKKILLRKD